MHCWSMIEQDAECGTRDRTGGGGRGVVLAADHGAGAALASRELDLPACAWGGATR